ncbi:kinase-like domain-containing protein, partial [Podospora aff. communis PSN243]
MTLEPGVASLGPPEDSNTCTLAKQLRAAYQGEHAREFIPIDDLDRLISFNNVRRELQRCLEKMKCEPEQFAYHGDLERLTREIVDAKPKGTSVHNAAITNEPVVSDARPTLTSRRALFTTLVLMERTLSISNFVRRGWWDCDLPFRKEERVAGDGDHCSRHYVMYSNDGRKVHDECFGGWNDSEFEAFCNPQQWRALAPYFMLATEEDREVRHYNLDYQWCRSLAILPLTCMTEAEPQPKATEYGGFGEVRLVKFHPAHHNHRPVSTPADGNECLFAVKTLRRVAPKDGSHHPNYYRQAFCNEVKALNRCSDKKHPYLIQLLLTYSYQDAYHLVFRWADCNMFKYWELNGDIENPKRTVDFAVWVASQLLGIAEGIQAIHNAGPRSSGRHYGRHGDLKPTNILWFRRGHHLNKQCMEFGQFVVSDFGLTQFHGEHSKDQVDTKNLALTDTYRPPECDVRSKISPRYDIWTLGCIFLEFCVWYSKGWKGVDKFSESRFFSTPNPRSGARSEPSTSPGAARLKKSVFEEFKSLYAHSNTTDLLYDLLELIRHHLLRVRPENRASCDDVVDRLQEINKNCGANPPERKRYCTDPRNPELIHPPSDLSELS